MTFTNSGTNPSKYNALTFEYYSIKLVFVIDFLSLPDNKFSNSEKSHPKRCFRQLNSSSYYYGKVFSEIYGQQYLLVIEKQ